MDSRIAYHRLPKNIGAAGNHNHVFTLARGELFKWASHDDLYGAALLHQLITEGPRAASAPTVPAL